MILIVGHEEDDHTTGVLDCLAQAGHPALLLDTARFPLQSSLTQRFGPGHQRFEYLLGSRAVDLGDCHVAWWRRPQQFELLPDMETTTANFAYLECHEAAAGLWAALDTTWVNPPSLDEVAHHKPYQLAIASRLGLPIPRTVITNDPEAVRALVDELGIERVVYKTFLATEEAWRETRLLQAGELALLDRVRLAPVIFQELIPAQADIRVTVVGDRVFSAAVTTAPGAYALDYRMSMDTATFTPMNLPAEVERSLLAFVRHLGLVYGAIDLRQRPDGEYVFLEVNPAGEWRFIEERTGQKITGAMAQLLIGLDRS